MGTRQRVYGDSLSLQMRRVKESQPGDARASNPAQKQLRQQKGNNTESIWALKRWGFIKSRGHHQPCTETNGSSRDGSRDGMETPSRCSGWESSLPPANTRAHFLLLARCTSGAMEPNYLRLSPEIVQQKRNPVASLWRVYFAVAARQNFQIPLLLYTSSEHTWYGVSVTPLLCLSLSFWKATKSMKAEPEVCVVP